MDSRLYEEIGKAVEKARKNNGDLTTQNLLYVVKVAKSVSKETGVDEDELIGVGTEAMKALESKYDSNKNDNFTKFCGMTLRGKMMNFINREYKNLVHIPVSDQKGFKKGQDAKEGTNVTYKSIDADDYDTLGECPNMSFYDEKFEVLEKGIDTLDEYGRKTIQIKFKLGEYKDIEHSSYQAMAEELEVTVPIAKKIYLEAYDKLKRYCISEFPL